MEAPDTTVAIEATKEEPQPSAEDYAARDWQYLLPKFMLKIEELSNRQLKRVVTALVEFPLQASEVHFSYPQEKELFNLGMQLFDCKMVLMKAIMDLKKDDIVKLYKELYPQEEAKTDDVVLMKEATLTEEVKEESK